MTAGDTAASSNLEQSPETFQHLLVGASGTIVTLPKKETPGPGEVQDEEGAHGDQADLHGDGDGREEEDHGGRAGEDRGVEAQARREHYVDQGQLSVG